MASSKRGQDDGGGLMIAKVARPNDDNDDDDDKTKRDHKLYAYVYDSYRQANEKFPFATKMDPLNRIYHAKMVELCRLIVRMELVQSRALLGGNEDKLESRKEKYMRLAKLVVASWAELGKMRKQFKHDNKECEYLLNIWRIKNIYGAIIMNVAYDDFDEKVKRYAIEIGESVIMWAQQEEPQPLPPDRPGRYGFDEWGNPKPWPLRELGRVDKEKIYAKVYDTYCYVNQMRPFATMDSNNKLYHGKMWEMYQEHLTMQNEQGDAISAVEEENNEKFADKKANYIEYAQIVVSSWAPLRRIFQTNFSDDNLKRERLLNIWRYESLCGARILNKDTLESLGANVTTYVRDMLPKGSLKYCKQIID